MLMFTVQLGWINESNEDPECSVIRLDPSLTRFLEFENIDIRHVLCETQTRNGREKLWRCAVDFRKVAVDFRGTGACETEEAQGPPRN